MNADAEAVELALSSSLLTSSGYMRAPCPFCTAEGSTDHKASLWMEHASGRWGCWKCHRWGRLPGYDVNQPRADPPPNLPVEFEPPDFFEPLSSELGANSLAFAPARNYLRKRKIPEETWALLGYGACLDGYWRGRVIVPHLDVAGTWRGWVGRVWTKKPPPGVLPYRYPSGMKRTLYNARVLMQQTDEPALLVEGALDAAHFPFQAAAFFGGPTEAHAREVQELAQRPVVVVLDGDAWEKGRYFAMRLRLDHIPAGDVRLPPKTDPDEVPRDWLLEEARRCISA